MIAALQGDDIVKGAGGTDIICGGIGDDQLFGGDGFDGFDASVPQLLRDVFTAAGGTHADWDEYDRVMAEDGRTAVFITPERIQSPG